jgi:hypothetical protein
VLREAFDQITDSGMRLLEYRIGSSYIAIMLLAARCSLLAARCSLLAARYILLACAFSSFTGSPSH